MFSYIKGFLVEKTPTSVVLECNNIGYDIKIPLSTYEKLGVKNSEVRLYVHLAVSEDDLKFYGFYTHAEKELFLLITTVSGIGPKIGLSILSAMSVASFIRAVRTDNDDALTIVPGLGKKKSQRLILELKDKLASFEALEIASYDEPGVDRVAAEAEVALQTLGYKQSDIRSAFDAILAKESVGSSELLIKMTIQYLYKGNAPGKKKG